MLPEPRSPPPQKAIPPERLKSAILAAQLDTNNVTTNTAIDIWDNLDYFSRYLYPATLDGLRFASSSDYNKVKSSNGFVLGLLLLFTIMLQCYALFGTAAISKIDNNSATIWNLQKQVQSMEAANPELSNDKKDGDSGYNTNSNTSSHKSYDLKRQELRGIEEAQCYAFRSVYQFNAVWGIIPKQTMDNYWAAEPFCSTDRSGPEYKDKLRQCKTSPSAECQTAYGTEFDAKFVVKILDTIVLPVMYSIMGAWVWIIRDRNAKRENRSLAKQDMRPPTSRIALAAALGSVLGFFSSSMFIGSALASVPLAGLGFLVGYNSELLFRWFDRVIGSVAKAKP